MYTADRLRSFIRRYEDLNHGQRVLDRMKVEEPYVAVALDAVVADCVRLVPDPKDRETVRQYLSYLVAIAYDLFHVPLGTN
jgi:hypothetical protein